MTAIIVWGILTLVIALMLGGLLSMQIQDRAEADVATLIIMFCFSACIFLYLNANHRYYEQKKYPATEYNINKQIIISDENDVLKVDTLYYFTKKTK